MQMLLAATPTVSLIIVHFLVASIKMQCCSLSLSLQKQKRSLAESTPRRRQQEKRVRASVSKRERGAFVSVATRLSAHFASELCAAKAKVVHRRTAKTTTNRNEARQTPQNFNHKQWKIYSMES